MILQGTTPNDTTALIEALTNAEAEKHRLESELVDTKIDLEDAKNLENELLAEFNTAFVEGVNSV